MRLVQRTLGQIDPPVGIAEGLAQRARVKPILDMAQGAPAYPPPPSILDRIAAVAKHPDGARYAPGMGLPPLRSTLADDLAEDYQGYVDADHVLITAGSNQAFCLTTSALAEAGDEVIVSVPFYFNHDMWVRLDQLQPIYVDTDPVTGQLPVDSVAESITSKTRLILLTSPGNPTGVAAAAEVVEQLADLARDRGVVLVLDETYRVFRPDAGPAHRIFQRPDWAEYFVSLQSFSKDFAMPGYRVGAVVASPDLLREVVKLMDCLAICAPRIGQEAAIEGLRSAGEWRRERVAEVALKNARFKEVMAGDPGGFELVASGGFYGWVRHPLQGTSSLDVAGLLAERCGVLTIPGEVFTPGDEGFVRVSYANVDLGELAEFGSRLSDF